MYVLSFNKVLGPIIHKLGFSEV